MNNISENKKNQESKHVSKKYTEWLEFQREKISEAIDFATKSKEILGYGDVSFEEFLQVTVNINADQNEADALISAQQDAKNAIEAQKLFFDEQRLLVEVSTNPCEDSICAVVDRIRIFREISDSVSADTLEKMLRDTSKKAGVRQKTIKNLLATPKKQKSEDDANELPFHVLGYNSERKVLLWHKGHLMHLQVSQIRADELALIVGPDFEAESLKNKIIEAAHNKGLVDEEDPIKSGLWRIDGEWLLVSGRDSLLIGADGAKPIDGPVFKNRIIHFERNGWVKTDRIAPGTCSLQETFDSLSKHIGQWAWEHADMADYVTAFVMLAPFQQAMHWRPWLYVTGPTSCGKSAFFENVLEQIYGRLVKKIDKATAHSVAQAVGGTSKILILDEFEKNRHIADIMEVLKLMGRGGSKTSGTPGKSEISYALHHMSWLASIYLPRSLSIDEAQRNRMVRFDLRKQKNGKFLDVLSSEEADSMCANIISSVVSGWEEIQKAATAIERKTGEIIESLDGKISARTVQNFMYASALLSIVGKGNCTVPEWARQEEIDDGQTIVRTIFNAKIRYDGGEYLISDLIEIAVGELIPGITLQVRQALNALRLNGLSVVRSGTWYVAFHPSSITKTLLRTDDDFKGLDLSAPLERIAGAKKNVKTSWGEGSRKEWCIHVPIECLFDRGW